MTSPSHQNSVLWNKLPCHDHLVELDAVLLAMQNTMAYSRPYVSALLPRFYWLLDSHKWIVCLIYPVARREILYPGSSLWNAFIWKDVAKWPIIKAIGSSGRLLGCIREPGRAVHVGGPEQVMSWISVDISLTGKHCLKNGNVGMSQSM